MRACCLGRAMLPCRKSCVPTSSQPVVRWVGRCMLCEGRRQRILPGVPLLSEVNHSNNISRSLSGHANCGLDMCFGKFFADLNNCGHFSKHRLFPPKSRRAEFQAALRIQSGGSAESGPAVLPAAMACHVRRAAHHRSGYLNPRDDSNAWQLRASSHFARYTLSLLILLSLNTVLTSL
jgi:hypothetical protein